MGAGALSVVMISFFTLKDLFKNYDFYISSPYKRANQTLSLITENNIEISDELTEMNLGQWEGLTTSEILNKYQENFIEALFINHKNKITHY